MGRNQEEIPEPQEKKKPETAELSAQKKTPDDSPLGKHKSNKKTSPQPQLEEALS
jgi:hypothetical protein